MAFWNQFTLLAAVLATCTQDASGFMTLPSLGLRSSISFASSLPFQARRGGSYAGGKQGVVMAGEMKGPGLVLGPRDKSEGEFFDSKSFARPVVKRYRTVEGDENWRMWYSGRDTDFDAEAIGISTGRTGLCESTDGIEWKRVEGDEALGSVLDFNEEEWWGYDTVHTMAGDVQIIATDKVRGSSAVSDAGYGVNFMFVSGGDAEEVDMSGVAFGGKTLPDETLIKGLRMRIGLALSYDGVHWTRMEGDHHSGAVFDVGEDGEFDSLMCGWPQVVQHMPGDLRMYYTTYDRDSEKWCVGLARSDDGFKWQKKGMVLSGGAEGAFDERGISRTWTVMNPTTRNYTMFCEGHGPQGHSIGTYTSLDGITFEPTNGGEPILVPSKEEGAWDAEHVAFPCVMPMDDGSCRLYYSCSPKEGGSGIGMAVSDGLDWSKFERYTADGI